MDSRTRWLALTAGALFFLTLMMHLNQSANLQAMQIAVDQSFHATYRTGRAIEEIRNALHARHDATQTLVNPSPEQPKPPPVAVTPVAPAKCRDEPPVNLPLPVESKTLELHCRTSGGSRTCCPVRDVPARSAGMARCSFSTRYEPCEQEVQWLDVAAQVQDSLSSLCPALTSSVEVSRSSAMLALVRQLMTSNRSLVDVVQAGLRLSKFVHTAECSDGKKEKTRTEWVEYIEPLGGTARHPFATGTMGDGTVCCCEFGQQATSMFSVDYILLHSARQPTFALRNPGRRLLFDVGTSYFTSSLQWLLCSYRAQAIEFDQVYAWEMQRLDPVFYWSQVPDDLKLSLHLLNVPVSGQRGHADNPLRLIEALTTVDDFVALKIDIDNTEIEKQILQPILDDPLLTARVDEVFFEYHFQSPFMGPLGWGNTHESSLSGALHWFSKFRQAGIRLHFWP